MRTPTLLFVSALIASACDSGSGTPADAPNGDAQAPIDATATIDATSPDAAPAVLAGTYTYVKATNTGDHDRFATSIALSGDGQTLAVGAFNEDSNAVGIDGDPADNSAADSGAVYVYTHASGSWQPEAYVKASNTDGNDWFGWNVALSADGNTLIVAAVNEASCTSGVDGPQDDDACGGTGAVYVFTRTGTMWSQTAYLKPSNTTEINGSKAFGSAIALSSDGSTIAVGGPGDSSAATGIDGDQADTSQAGSGAVYVFTRAGATWSQQAYVKASNTHLYDAFGGSVALSADGSVMAVAAVGEDSGATGVDGSQADDSKSGAGAVYMFSRSGTTWMQRAYVKASNTDAGDEFGVRLAISAAGTTLAVCADGEDSGATDVDGDQTDNSQIGAGAVYMFTQSGSTWAQQAYLKAANTYNGQALGLGLALSANGNTVLAGAYMESGGGTGLTVPGASMIPNSGAAFAFRRTGSAWTPLYYLKATNTGMLDGFGYAAAMSADASRFAIGAFAEASVATGIDGDQSSNGAVLAGAAYVIE